MADPQPWEQSPWQKLVLGVVEEEAVALGSGNPSSAVWEGWSAVARVSSGTQLSLLPVLVT